LLELAPENQTGLINLAVSLEARGEYAKAEALFRRSLAIDTLTFQSQIGLIRTLGGDGRLDEAGRLASTGRQRLPRSSVNFDISMASVLWGGGKLDSAARVAAGAMGGASEPMQRATVSDIQVRIAAARGKLADADRFAAAQVTSGREAGAPGFALNAALDAVVRTAWYRGDRVSASRQLDEALKAMPLASMEPVDRPFGPLVDAQLSVGKLDAAKATLADFTKAYTAIGTVPDTNMRSQIEGAIALAEKKYDVAVAKFRERTIDMDFGCRTTCESPRLAQAFDMGGRPDSAIAVYEKYLGTKDMGRVYVDGIFLGPSIKRLGELYEAKGDRDNAAKWYAQFVDLWKNADPELQPSVKDVQSRLSRLRTAEPVIQVTPSGGAMPKTNKKP
jgi:tetratricopeptide (TPR) repeat protein